VDERLELLGQEDGLHSSQTEGAAQAPRDEESVAEQRSCKITGGR